MKKKNTTHYMPGALSTTENQPPKNIHTVIAMLNIVAADITKFKKSYYTKNDYK
jgi:hypothetical protein